jgi:hypothetical protein
LSNKQCYFFVLQNFSNSAHTEPKNLNVCVIYVRATPVQHTSATIDWGHKNKNRWINYSEIEMQTISWHRYPKLYSLQ